jgi:branched-chain amino acid transport system ATP-binding protein
MAAALLTVNQLRIRYRNGAIGVSDVSLEVESGQVGAVFGPNGAGKTSTVRGVSGFLRTEGARVTHGSVIFGDRDTTNHEPHYQGKLGIAFVPEREKVFPSLTVAENIATVRAAPSPERRDELTDLVNTLFPVLSARRRELAGKLSGGQRQMLALACAVMSDPKLLIVDEMTLGLHHSLQPLLYDAVRAITSMGTAMLLVDESTGFVLELADYAYLLSAGVVIDEGRSEKFRGNELLAAGYVDRSPC